MTKKKQKNALVIELQKLKEQRKEKRGDRKEKQEGEDREI